MSERSLNPSVQPGDVVLDVGCALTRALHAAGHAGLEPRPARVVAVFPWGLRIAALDDPGDESDCQNWTHSAAGDRRRCEARVAEAEPLSA